MTEPTPIPAVSVAQPTRVLYAFGEEVHLHLTGAETGGQQTLWTEITPPGGGPPPHYHQREDETFYVLEGHVSFLRDGKWHDSHPGAVVFMPRNVIHAFKNIGDTPARMLISTSPAGFETFFARCAEEFAQPNGPDMNRIVAISAEHGIHFIRS